MGGIVWHEFARLMCLSATFVLIVGGIVGTVEPLPNFDALRKLTGLYAHPVPVLPTILIVLGLIVVVIECPLVARDYFNSSDSYMPRVAFYIPVCVLAFLEAQTCNGGVYLGIGAFAYMQAIRADFLKNQQSAWGRLP
ncbi:hypothetical protein EMPS_06506 [Entomortierella parvispora]|uniref:DUF7727 domain-containing protein n=1 Tax=Entomortierella parvispora TaxID=205924 RepID=A0A9P3HD42_9FUNG|nr:hypothetical protein EMPS_06506 [Entomortierella parvispora]